MMQYMQGMSPREWYGCLIVLNCSTAFGRLSQSVGFISCNGPIGVAFME